ncbi:MAG TPA: site-specific DNA-methyltransferase [Pseudonocardiaceae bacterium]|jgi:adenine-specific DNA-methyltransferase|nr:site-specific DNA-methyltransferase [Pseudonocardiaceae bacterium]
MSGRLTLSWVNKDKALVPDEDGGYQWVERDDPRLIEVRLLHQAGRIGEVSGTVEDNLLIQGDSYDALYALSRTPEYAQRYRGKIKLVYIDPPFNTGQAFEHYDDALEHSVWLGMMRERLLLIRELLAPDGSVWVHLDDAEMAYCRVLLDEVFGRGNFVGTVIWQRSDSPRNDAIGLSVDHDYIMAYSRDSRQFKLGRLERTAAMNAVYSNPDNDPRGPWHADNLTCNKSEDERRNLAYPITDPATGITYPYNPRRVWAYDRMRMDELIADRRIIFPKKQTGRPQLKRFLNELDRGRAPQTVWTHEEAGHTRGSSREIQRLFPDVRPFATPKPEKLLERIVQVGSNTGDIVLDCFLGSGTTAAVAHKMGRKWVGVELSAETIQNFTHPRLEKVTAGHDLGGITKDVDWSGGGGFRMLTVGPSLFERAGSRLLLADWAKGEEFAQAVAAQLGFIYEFDGPFAGVKGRARLAVVDGVADDVVVKSIVSHLNEDERVTVVVKAAAPGTEQMLRELSSGSRLLKAPRDLVRRGRVVR